jgi:hypothetical protein
MYALQAILEQNFSLVNSFLVVKGDGKPNNGKDCYRHILFQQ